VLTAEGETPMDCLALEGHLETFETINEWGFVYENGTKTTVTQFIGNALLSTDSTRHVSSCEFLLTMITNDNEFYQLGKAPGPQGDRIICTIAVKQDILKEVIQARTQAYHDLLASSHTSKKKLERCLTMITKKPSSFINTSSSSMESMGPSVRESDITKASEALCDLSSPDRLGSVARRIRSSPISDTSPIANLTSPSGKSLSQARNHLLSHLS